MCFLKWIEGFNVVFEYVIISDKLERIVILIDVKIFFWFCLK